MMEQYILKEQTRHGTSLFPLACYRMEQAENFTVPLHWHEETEILFLEQGSFHYSCNMQEQVIAAPAFVVFPSGSIHSLTASQNPSANSLVFRLDMLQFCGCDHIQSGLLEPLLEGRISFPPLILPDHPCYCEFCRLYRDAFVSAEKGSLPSHIIVKARLLEILALLYEHDCLTPAAESTLRPELLSNAKLLIRYMQEHYSEKLTVSQMAELTGLNEQYFCRYFRRLFGKTFTGYLNEIRLEQAAGALLQSDKRVIDIAMEHGFDHVGYFIRCFRRYTGMTPQAYRKSQNSDMDSSK
ncbi:AraC family transcriptional regulator [Cuneatibacter caecimuris]|uniref:AraC-like DNA-binding protein n=1 Tax=Cuneatibacter caecimuris TaxID=1796618 RepID=A0A4Q7PNN1_9FIRM|nr:AraC family transcriptional regulator [Cuneatibacter caecimuris]RZT02413.1 AraC-like DNA-binding protein [Cuneatibacter caecimuris]